MSDYEARCTWIKRFMLARGPSFPFQELVRLYKLVSEWVQRAGKNSSYSVNDVEDLQNFLVSSDDSWKVLLSFRDLAREYTRRGQLENGVKWLKRCLARVDCTYDPRSAHSARFLGIVYDQQNKVEIAKQTQEKLQEKALAQQEAVLPRNHLETILTVNELGRVYRHLGGYDKSASMHLRALGVLREVLPADDLQIVWTLNTPARNYLKQGRILESINLHQKALASQEIILGKEHPHALWTMTDLARCYCGQGNFGEALSLQQKVVDARSRVLGSYHADTLWSMNFLALLLESLGRKDEAMVWHKKAHQSQVLHLGKDHEHAKWTQDALQRLAG